MPYHHGHHHHPNIIIIIISVQAGSAAADAASIVQCVKGLTLQQIADAAAPQDLGANYYWHMIMDGPNGLWPKSMDELAAERPKVPSLIGTNKDSYNQGMIAFPTVIAGWCCDDDADGE